jgi:tetratricopeptide (TPR) repeat protein
MRARSITFLGLLLLGSMAPLAWAQDDPDATEAKHQFIAGTKAFSAGRFQEAAQAFETAAALKPNAVALYTAALAWEQANQNERAADDYARALDLPGNALQPQQSSTARDRLAALEKVLGTVAVTGPDGFKVQLDQFSEVPVPARLHGTGGTHALSVRAPGKQPEKREVMLEGNVLQKVDVTPTTAIVIKKEEQQPQQPKEVIVERPAQGGHFSPLKAIGFSAIGAGGIGVLGAIMLGISAQDAGDAYNAAPSHAGYVHANALASWTTGVWIGAGVLLAAGITLVLIPEGHASPPPTQKKPEEKPEEAARLTLTPSIGGFMLRGSF